jgi:hypothetical protein
MTKIRILKLCKLGKPGRSILDPTKEEIAFAKANPTIARIYGEVKTPRVMHPVENLEPEPEYRPTTRKGVKHGAA